MEVKDLISKISALVTKYRYAAIILLIGILLMLIPSGSKNELIPTETVIPETTEQTAEDKLGNILSKIQGAGKVEVILSFASGAETLYHGNTETDGTSVRSDTVIVSDSDKNQSALITRIDPPVYLGAIVVCQGADSASVRLAIVDAVSKYTGLGADRISVLKMK